MIWEKRWFQFVILMVLAFEWSSSLKGNKVYKVINDTAGVSGVTYCVIWELRYNEWDGI